MKAWLAIIPFTTATRQSTTMRANLEFLMLTMVTTSLSFRALAKLGLVISGLLIAAAMFMQYGLGWEPCLICHAQRYLLVIIALLLLLALLKLPRWLEGGLAMAVAAVSSTGVALSIRHLRIQYQPQGIGSCGAGFEEIFETLPLFQALSSVWQGSGDCSDIDYVIGVPLSAWMLLVFLAFALCALTALFQSRRINA
ncbi:disulfide bond formation protein B [Gammaproteobacteria bacterium]|nr:disulfide bond formation protein B [Gammaproteobacteria bacterium]